MALISVGADNDYGHPTAATLGRLRDAGARVYRTDLDGTVEVDLRADGIGVRTSGARRTAAGIGPGTRPGWRPPPAPPPPATIHPMTIPSRPEAARLLRSLEPPEWFLRHACAVADVAAWLARRAAARGLDVDTVLVDTAALLHDVDKLPAAGIRSVAGPRSGLRHGDGSAAWLEARGWGELAPVVRDHPVTRLADPDYEAWVGYRVARGADRGLRGQARRPATGADGRAVRLVEPAVRDRIALGRP